MNTLNVSESFTSSPANASSSAIRPFYWSVWRELWENRSIYIAPLIVAAVQVFGRSVMFFENIDRGQLAPLGEVRRPSIADLFVAVMGRGPEIGSQKSENRGAR